MSRKPPRLALHVAWAAACIAAALQASVLESQALSLGQAKPLPPRPAPAVRVYVFTATTDGQPSEEERGRRESLEELREALAKRRSEFTLVTRAEEAQVTVELVNREEREAGQGGFGGKSVSRFRETIVRLRVSAVDAQGDLKGVGQGSWKSAAKDAAERLARWVKNHDIGDG